MFRELNAAAVAAYFMKKAGTLTMSRYDLLKLMYAAEKESLRGSVKLITGDDFVNMDKGPVMSHVYDCMKGRGDGTWNKFFAVSGYHVRFIGGIDPAEVLEPCDLEYLDRAWDAVSPILKLPFDERVTAMHEYCPEWDDPKPYRQTTLELQEIFHKGLNDDVSRAESKASLVTNAEGLRTWFARHATSG